jgi:phosphatidylethanolamine-binding protein (PEBP) family uncharacterized protein
MKTPHLLLALALGVSAQAAEAAFEFRSPAVAPGGRLPTEYTGDGAGATPPLEWTAPPAGTKAFAVIMHHVDPEGKTKWYWTLYNIPAGVTNLTSNARGIGTAGNNSVNGRTGYAPPHSKGPGDKTYVLTLYALSATVQPAVPSAEVTRDVLLAAMKDKVLGTAELKVVYARNDVGSSTSSQKPGDLERRGPPGEPPPRPGPQVNDVHQNPGNHFTP